MHKLCVLMVLLLLAACAERTSLAPVVELRWKNPSQKVHIVRRGETVYAIAFRYDIDFRLLAEINNIKYPYTVRAGQILKLKTGLISRPVNRYPLTTKIAAGNSSLKRKKEPKPRLTEYKANRLNNGHWISPINGKVAVRFSPQQGKKGIDIAGKKGEKIRAAETGIVAYAGSGLSGYGNLIIIKHNNHFLTAYGNNSRNLVKEGQKVKAGQIIAEIGVINRNYWGVHFEIRKDGIPVNPLGYIHP